MRATKVNAGLAESNGRLLLGMWRDSFHVTCGLTACTPGSAPGPTLGNEYGKTLPYWKWPAQGTGTVPLVSVHFRSLWPRRRVCGFDVPGDVSGDLTASEGSRSDRGDDLDRARTLPCRGRTQLGPLLRGGQHGRRRPDVPVLAEIFQAAVQSHYQHQ